MMECDLFFPPGTRVLTLPNRKNPRLYLPASGFVQRWEDSSFYPAFRLLARLYRLSVRVKATAGLGEVWRVRSGNWPLGEFVRDILPGAASAVVLVGTPGPAQKITARIRDEEGGVLGYLKYAENETARERLGHERRMLSHIPEGAGPRLLKYGAFGGGEALLTTLVAGKQLPATLPPAGDLSGYLTSLAASHEVPVADHPWVGRIRERSDLALEPWLEDLTGRDWPVVFQHGDFAPWNVLRAAGGTLAAIDWEYGTLEGFPHLDLAYYLLQTSALIYRRAPLSAARHAAEYLSSRLRPAPSRAEVRSLVRLAAYDAYQRFRELGRLTDTDHLQCWRRTIWEDQTCGA